MLRSLVGSEMCIRDRVSRGQVLCTLPENKYEYEVTMNRFTYMCTSKYPLCVWQYGKPNYPKIRPTVSSPNGRSTAAGRWSCRRREVAMPSLLPSSLTSRDVAAAGGKKPSLFRCPIIGGMSVPRDILEEKTGLLSQHLLCSSAVPFL